MQGLTGLFGQSKVNCSELHCSANSYHLSDWHPKGFTEEEFADLFFEYAREVRDIDRVLSAASEMANIRLTESIAYEVIEHSNGKQGVDEAPFNT